MASSPPADACSSCGGSPVFVKKRGLCRSCYYRWKRHGDPAAGGPREKLSALERFNYYAPDQSDPERCWIWTGPTQGRDVCDYGRLYVGIVDGKPRMVQAHRWSYEHFVGPIQEGYEIDHVKSRGCVTTLCVNPAHLEPVTHKVNVQRGDAPSAQYARRDCCPECGGPWTIYKNQRRCRPCFNAKMRKWMFETGRTTGEGQGVRQREKTHCDNGHEFTPENTYVRPPTRAKPNPSRDCMECRRRRRNESAARVRARKKAG